MFKVEEEKSVDFLTQQSELRKSNLQGLDNELDEGYEEKTWNASKGKFWDHEKNSVVSKPESRADRIKIKVRFDYRGTARPGRFFFGGKNTEEVAEELREQRMSYWQNVPIQGLHVEDIKVFDVYTIIEEYDDGEEEVSYAPIEVVLSADSLEDCIYLVSREEFRKMEILHPEEITLSAKDLEKLFVKYGEAFRKLLLEFG